jgi:hypothetical protein
MQLQTFDDFFSLLLQDETEAERGGMKVLL